MDVESITDFILLYSPYKDREVIKDIIQKHLEYKTAIVVYDDNEIIAVCRWNISPSGRNANILDLIIRPDWRKKNLIKRILLKGLRMYPNVKWLVYEKGYDTNKPMKKISVEKLLKYRRMNEV